MILLNNMDTFIRAINPPLAIIIHIMQDLSILPMRERMVPGGEVEVEGGGKGIEV